VIVDVALYRDGIRTPAPADISDQVDIANVIIHISITSIIILI
jgi:hypothetical protein